LKLYGSDEIVLKEINKKIFKTAPDPWSENRVQIYSILYEGVKT
jgi:hypothetical protein